MHPQTFPERSTAFRVKPWEAPEAKFLPAEIHFEPGKILLD